MLCQCPRVSPTRQHPGPGASPRSEGVSFIDLYPKFHKKGRSGGLFVFQEARWNEASNWLVGKVPADWVGRSGLRAGGSEAGHGESHQPCHQVDDAINLLKRFVLFGSTSIPVSAGDRVADGRQKKREKLAHGKHLKAE